jgi:hypothetical protein
MNIESKNVRLPKAVYISKNAGGRYELNEIIDAKE